MTTATGPEALPQFEDRLLYHLVKLTGNRPIARHDGLSEADIAVQMAQELGISLDFARSDAFYASDVRLILLSAVENLEIEGLVSSSKHMGPWTISPTLTGRRRVAEWHTAWEQSQQKTDRAVQRRILEELDRQRHSDPANYLFTAKVDIDQLCANLGVSLPVYVANAQRLLDQGKIEPSATEQATLNEGFAFITETGIRALETTVAIGQPQRSVQEAWVEVARLRRQLQVAERSLPSLIADPELRQRCADLLTAEGHYDRAIREACVILEDRIRAAIGVGKDLIGTALMEHAFGVRAGRIRLSAHEPEQVGAMQIYRGVMALFRNSAGHNLIDSYTQEDAVRFVVWIDLLLHMVDQVQSISAGSSTP